MGLAQGKMLYIHFMVLLWSSHHFRIKRETVLLFKRNY